MKKTNKQVREKGLHEIVSDINTWDTTEMEVSFLATVCFLVEGEKDKSETKHLLEILTQIDETWFTEIHRKAIFYVIRKIYTDSSSSQFVLPGSIAMMAEQILKLRGHDKECDLIEKSLSSPSMFYSIEAVKSILPYWRIKLIRKKMMTASEEMLEIFTNDPDGNVLLERVPQLIEQQQDIWNGLSSSNQKNDDWDSSVSELLAPLPDDVTVSTGLTVLDDAIQGGIAARNSPYSGRLIVVAARPSMGKSTMAIYLATQLAHCHGDVAFFSLEMSRKQIQYKAISCYDYMALREEGNLTNPIRSNNLRLRNYTIEQRERLEGYAGSRFSKRFHIYDSAENINTIATKVALLAKTKQNLSAVFIDYLQLIEGCSGDANNTEASNIGNVTRSLKQLAVRTGVDIFLLSQVNRGVESRTDKMPTMADLRASGRIEEDADIVMFLLRPYYYDNEKDPYELAIGVAKNRHGICGTLQCCIDLQSSIIFDQSLARRMHAN